MYSYKFSDKCFLQNGKTRRYSLIISNIKFIGLERSSNQLNEYELSVAKEAFEKFDVENVKSLDYEEIKPLLLHLNLMMEDKTLNEYISFVTKNDGTASKRGSTGNGQEPSYMNSNISYDTFMNLFKSILANQSDYFRAVY